MDVLHVPSYAKYIKDIINNKQPLPSMEVIKLTEVSTTAILDFPEKKKDLGCPMILCSIGIQYFDQALCDLGASVSVMPKAVYDKLIHMPLTPTPMMLQLADSTARHPAGIVEDILVKIRDCYVPIDFVVLDMEVTKESTLILGWPFLSTTKAQIDVGAGEIRFNIHGNEEKITFRPRKEQCSMICIKYGPNPQSLRELHIQPQKVDRPVKKSKEIKRKSEQKKVKQFPKKISQKLSPHPKEASVETKRRSSKVHHHTTKNKQNGVEAEEGAALHIHFSKSGYSIIEQEMNGEGSYSLDLKQ
jgi:hypothetical protein